KINKKTQNLNEILGQINQINIFRTINPSAEENTFLSSQFLIFILILMAIDLSGKIRS
ncbi:unnamed protein product, partial [Rangifer tarandus platyrhynchus]